MKVPYCRGSAKTIKSKDYTAPCFTRMKPSGRGSVKDSLVGRHTLDDGDSFFVLESGKMPLFQEYIQNATIGEKRHSPNSGRFFGWHYPSLCRGLLCTGIKPLPSFHFCATDVGPTSVSVCPCCTRSVDHDSSSLMGRTFSR